MKKQLVVIIVALVAVFSFALGSYASAPVRIFVNGNELTPDVPAQIIDGRTMVPIRFVAEALGVEVNWDANTNSVLIGANAPAVPSTQRFTGSGKDFTTKFSLNEGLTYITYKYTGDSNFAVWFLNGNGEKVDLIANEIGSCNGKTAVSVKQGTYLFDIKASGPWTITVEQ
jgi:hypothetical protein